ERCIQGRARNRRMVPSWKLPPRRFPALGSEADIRPARPRRVVRRRAGPSRYRPRLRVGRRHRCRDHRTIAKRPPGTRHTGTGRRRKAPARRIARAQPALGSRTAVGSSGRLVNAVVPAPRTRARERVLWQGRVVDPVTTETASRRGGVDHGRSRVTRSSRSHPCFFVLLLAGRAQPPEDDLRLVDVETGRVGRFETRRGPTDAVDVLGTATPTTDDVVV